MRPDRRPLGLLALSFILTFGLVLGATAAAAQPYPNSMAATGDSITRAYNTGSFPFIDNPAASWSTGTTSSVNSHYLRVLSANPLIKGKNYNDAKSGAKMADLNAQMITVNSQHVDYVTVLMGGNDICTSTVDTMTSPATFAAQFTSAMTTITAGSPSAYVFVASIPNAYRLWQILKDNTYARRAWSTYKICQSLLANPLSTADGDVARRNAVLQRNIELNQQLAQVCATFVQCRFDGNAVFNTAFAASDISTRDYFHPSVAGQAKLASATWPVSYWAP